MSPAATVALGDADLVLEPWLGTEVRCYRTPAAPSSRPSEVVRRPFIRLATERRISYLMVAPSIQPSCWRTAASGGPNALHGSRCTRWSSSTSSSATPTSTAGVFGVPDALAHEAVASRTADYAMYVRVVTVIPRNRTAKVERRALRAALHAELASKRRQGET